MKNLSSKASKRYANAFLEMAIELDKLEFLKKDIDMIGDTVNQSKDLITFLKSPVIKPEIKQNALKEIFEKHVAPETFRLIEILSVKKRENLLPGIVESFKHLYDKHKNIKNVSVSSAYTIEKETEQVLIKTLKKITGKNIRLSKHVDKNLIGGISVRIEDTVVDATVKHKLSRLKDEFRVQAV